MPAFDKNTEEFLESLGIYQIVIPTPFPQAGDVYSYLIRDKEGFFLIDAGIKTEEAREKFFSQLNSLGVSLKDIKKIFLTHGHVDHYGLAREIQEISGAEVFIHEKDWIKVHQTYYEVYEREAIKYKDFFISNGIPSALADALINAGKNFKIFADQLEEVNTINDGEKVEYLNGSFYIIHLPGHTPGCIGFYDKKNKLLISGDTLLSKISPNPLIELGENGDEDRFRSLPSYFNSLEKIVQLELQLVVPAHGEAIIDHIRTIKTLKKFYKTRQWKILKTIEKEELTPFEIALKTFPDKKNEIYLVFSEIIGNLDVLEEEGLVLKTKKDGKIFYRGKTDELVAYR